MKLKYYLLIFIPVILLASGLFFYFIYYEVIVPIDATATGEQNFVIEKKTSLKQIAINLEEAGIVRNRFVFAGYIYYKGWASNLQAGEYGFSPSLNTIQVARKIVGGDIIPNEIKITIPEGFNLKQIDSRLADAGLIGAGGLSKQNELEGYLFPDTYNFDKYETIDRIISKMKNNFDDKIGDELKAEIANQGKTLNDIIIMASIIEKEVSDYQDRQIVSGIFWNRIENNYPLQSCATIGYVLGEDKRRYSIEDTKVNSPYNTYQNAGLPIGPICSPGLSAIKAAIYPIATEYNFFLSKSGTGETVFSRTAEEHKENKALYLQ